MSADPRVQAIRCMHCHRLRPYPTWGRPECYCGGMRFEPTFPHPDEEAYAMQIYKDDLEQAACILLSH